MADDGMDDFDEFDDTGVPEIPYEGQRSGLGDYSEGELREYLEDSLLVVYEPFGDGSEPIVKRVPVPPSVMPVQYGEEFSNTLEDTLGLVAEALKVAYATGGSFSLPDLEPDDIYFALKDFVLYQDKALRQVAVATSNHLRQIPEGNPSKRAKESISKWVPTIKYPEDDEEGIEVARKGLFVVGGTGVGKTHSLRELAKVLGVPFVSVNATRITLEGYVGGKITDVLEETKEKAAMMGDPELYKYSIIHFDEVDKLVAEKTHGKDVGGAPVLEALLGYMQSGKVRVKKQTPFGEQIDDYDTSNMLFVFSGACEGVEGLIKKRMKIGEKKPVGFDLNTKAKETDLLEENPCDLILKVEREDLANWGAGFPRQFLGRIGAVIPLRSFNAEQLAKILIEPKNSFFDQYRYVWGLQGMALSITEGAIDSVGEKAEIENLGARGLTHVLDPILNQYQFDLGMIGAKELELTREIIEDPEGSKHGVIKSVLAKKGYAPDTLDELTTKVIDSLEGDCELARKVKTGTHLKGNGNGASQQAAK